MSNQIEELKAKLIEIQKLLDQVKLIVDNIEKESACQLCGGDDHTAKDCIDTQPETTDDRDFHQVDEDDSDSDDTIYKSFFCYRCGRKGHYSSQCYASTHINGDDLDDYTEHYDSE